jgi:hypothetical protein
MVIEIKYGIEVTAKEDFTEKDTKAFCRKDDKGFIVNKNSFIVDSDCYKKVKVLFQERNFVVEIPLKLLKIEDNG